MSSFVINGNASTYYPNYSYLTTANYTMVGDIVTFKCAYSYTFNDSTTEKSYICSKNGSYGEWRTVLNTTSIGCLGKLCFIFDIIEFSSLIIDKLILVLYTPNAFVFLPVEHF